MYNNLCTRLFGFALVCTTVILAGSLPTTTGKDHSYAFFFDQQGLMAGLGLMGGKISKITPDE